MRKKILVQSLVLVFAVAVFASCASSAPEPSKPVPEPQNSTSQSGISIEEELAKPQRKSPMFKRVAEEIKPFTLPPMPEELPEVYSDKDFEVSYGGGIITADENNGKFGFKDSEGNILVPAEYDHATPFDHFSIGSLRIDGATGADEPRWYNISPYGYIAEFDSLYFHDNALSIASEGGKYGLVNTRFEEILPLEYDYISATYLYDSETGEGQDIIYYAKKGDNFFQIDIENKLIYSYEPYVGNEVGEDIIILADYDIIVINGTPIINGKRDETGQILPLPILEMMDFDVYIEGEKTYTGKGDLHSGAYESTYKLHFKCFTKEEDGNDEFNAYVNYDMENISFAVNSEYTPLALNTMKDATAYDDTVMAYMTDGGFENTQYQIDKVLTYERTGKTFALVEANISDEFRNELMSNQWEGVEIDDFFLENKWNVFSALLYIPDIKNITVYEIMSESLSTDMHGMTSSREITALRQSEDGTIQAIIQHNPYEGLPDYSIVPLGY